MAKEQKNPPSSEQSRRFVEMARQVGCDEDEAAFKEKLGVIARQKPKPKGASPKSDTRDDQKPDS